ncbi:MAG: hypothetical protein J6J79_07670 [Lachnospiraceae bacterium]|nr:hypothetical protein [Lachnospiraceae bacterium]
MKKEVNKKILAGGVLLLLAIALILMVFLHSHKTQGMIETIGQQKTTDNEKLLEELQNVSLYLEQMDVLWSSFFVTLVAKKMSDCFPEAIRVFRFHKGCFAPLERLSP